MTFKITLLELTVSLTIAVPTVLAQATNTFPSSGNVGIGTTGPQDALDIENGGYLRVGNFFHAGSEGSGSVVFAPSGNYIRFSVGSSQPLWLASSGKVGIGTANPGSPLTIVAPDNPAQLEIQSTSAGGHDWGIASWGTHSNFTSGGLGFGDYTAGYWRMYIDGAGNVGVGTTNPGYTLDVAGSFHVSQAISASGGITFADGSSQTTAFNTTLCGGDYAESVDVTGNRPSYEPGDVLVIDPSGSGRFLKSAEPYSTSVTGIFSTKPGAIGRRQTTVKSADEVPMAMVGIVPTKVSAENGPIRPGDLLVTASRPGYAMKGTDRSRMLGAVIGKALGTLNSDTGVIEVVVTLQ